MSRETLLARTLVDLADTLVADFDVVELLTRLADGCVDVLDVGSRRDHAGRARRRPARDGFLVRGDARARAVRAPGETGPVPRLLSHRNRRS